MFMLIMFINLLKYFEDSLLHLRPKYQPYQNLELLGIPKLSVFLLHFFIFTKFQGLRNFHTAIKDFLKVIY